MRFSKSSLMVLIFGLFSTTAIAKIQDAEFIDVLKKSNASIRLQVLGLKSQIGLR
jgi:hypothetical protein